MDNDPGGHNKEAHLHRERAFSYEEKAVDFANTAFRTLSYLNGGALVAIPAAVALFGIDPSEIRTELITAGILFVAGLFLVLASQGAAFFTMARRAESELFLQFERTLLSYAVQFDKDREKHVKEAQEQRQKAEVKFSRSNIWRFWGLAFIWVSAAAFVAGCFFSTRVLLA